MSDSANPLRINQYIDGFFVRRVTPLENLRSTAYELIHEPTAARILHLHNADAENLISVTFPTPPPDDTGVPHILEHSVLAGSRRYRVKDPFFEMVKCSMATFINAMTGSDYTVYPVASNVRRDFYNLAEVYWDAVFHPLLTEKTFQREGHHLEFAVKGDVGSDLIVKGIVYNEMKGARSSPEAKVYELIEKNLWPDTPYGKDAGGDPEKIPDLTWKGLRDFHGRFYHPSNAYIFLYGDIPTADHLRFLGPRLAEFGKTDARPELPRQPRWKQPRRVEDVYPVASSDPTDGKTFIVLNWLIGSGIDAGELFAFSALDRILLGNQSAPLRKALVDSKLGQDVTHSGFWANGVDTSFHVGLKGSEPERAERVLDVVRNTLAHIAEDGVSKEQFDAAVQQLKYRYLEITPSFPLHLMGFVMGMWQHGADPLALLHAERHIRKLNDDFAAKPALLFTDLIREKLLDNPHRLVLVVRPDREIQQRKDAEFAGKMRKLKDSLSPVQLEEIRKDQDELDALLNTPNSPEAIASLPQLKVADLPPKPRHIATSVERISGGGLMLNNDVFANGVNYLHVSFDLTGLPGELYTYLQLYGDCVQKMGAAGQDFVAIAQRVSGFTGGVGFSAGVTTAVDDPNRIVRHAVFATKFLDENVEQALAVVRDLVFELDPRDVGRLKDVLLQSRAHQRSRPTSDGLGLAVRHAARGVNLDGHLQEILGGIPQIFLLERITEAAPEPLLERIDAIRRFLLNRRRLTVSFTGSPGVTEVLRRRLGEWAAAMRDEAIAEASGDDFVPAAVPPRDGLAAPMNVAYCAMAMPSAHISHPDGPRLAVAARLLSLGYVLEEVRFKGTAYGGGCTYNGAGRLWAFHSYRDPWVNRTLDVYASSLDHVKSANWSQGDVDRAIIGTAKEGERPIRPTQATGTALSRYLTGDTRQLREARHAAMLGVTVADVRRVLIEQFERNAKRAAVCVVSSRQKLEEANAQRPDRAMEIRDILSAPAG
ncbi:MAG: insulinase family protein [Tepidisphaeraceae bacterium]